MAHPRKDRDVKEIKDMRLNMKAARINMGYTQAQLGKMVGLSRRSIGCLESGERNTDINTWIKIRKALMINDIEDLIEKWTYKEGYLVSENGKRIRVF